MFLKKIAFMAFFVGFAPICAFGSMVYVPSRPCSSVFVNQNSGGCGYQTGGQTNRDFKGQNSRVSGKSVNADWYLAANFGFNMWSWENEYKSDWSGVMVTFDKDRYSFKSVVGGSVALGKYFDSGVRGDIELGITSDFSDSDDSVEIKMSLPYLMANVYYDFESGFYLGAGLGMTRSTIEIDGALFNKTSGAKNSSVSPKLGLSAGYSGVISDNTFIDLRYRLSGMKGGDVSAGYLWDEYEGEYVRYNLRVDTGLIIENTVSIGLRYNF